MNYRNYSEFNAIKYSDLFSWCNIPIKIIFSHLAVNLPTTLLMMTRYLQWKPRSVLSLPHYQEDHVINQPIRWRYVIVKPIRIMMKTSSISPTQNKSALHCELFIVAGLYFDISNWWTVSSSLAINYTVKNRFTWGF